MKYIVSALARIRTDGLRLTREVKVVTKTTEPWSRYIQCYTFLHKPDFPFMMRHDISSPHEMLPRRQAASLGVTMTNRASGCHHDAAADAMLKQAHHDALSKFATIA